MHRQRRTTGTISDSDSGDFSFVSEKDASRAANSKLGIRWTIGDVSGAGFEALRLSVRSAVKLFGNSARYAVCANTILYREAGARTGEVDHEIEWLDVNGLVPNWFHSFVGPEMAEGVAWKLSPTRVFPDLH